MAFCENDLPLFDQNATATLRILDGLESFRSSYEPIHGYVCLFICVFGVSTNLMHIVVLSRPTMRNTAVNAILSAIAICDTGTMASYLVYLVHFVLTKGDPGCRLVYTRNWIYFLLWHVGLSIALHTTSLWLAVAIALVRRMTLRDARLGSRWQRADRAWRICVAVYVCVFILCLPTMLVHETAEYGAWQPDAHCHPSVRNDTQYTIAVPAAARGNGCRVFKANLWLTGICFKVIPCVLLMVLSVSLLQRLRAAEQKRRLLFESSRGAQSRARSATADRTTTMLIIMLLVFLATELPQGAVAILSAIFTTDVHQFVYYSVGDVLDLLSLVNSSLNFILYCVMSSRYRQTFCDVFLPARLLAWLATATPKRQSRQDDDVTELVAPAVAVSPRPLRSGCRSASQPLFGVARCHPPAADDDARSSSVRRQLPVDEQRCDDAAQLTLLSPPH